MRASKPQATNFKAIRIALALALCAAPFALFRQQAFADDWASPYEVFSNPSNEQGAYNIPINQSPQDVRLQVAGFSVGTFPEPTPVSSDGQIELTRGGSSATIGFSWANEGAGDAAGTITMSYQEEPAYGVTGSANFESQLLMTCSINQIWTIDSIDDSQDRTEQYQLTQSGMGLSRVINGVQYLMFPLYTSDGNVGYTDSFIYLELTAVRGLAGGTTSQQVPQTQQKQTEAYWQLSEVFVPETIEQAQHEYGEYALYFNELGLLMLDLETQAGVEFYWSEPPEKILCGEESSLEIQMGVFPYESSSWVAGTAFGSSLDVVNAAKEELYVEYSMPLFCDFSQSGEPLEYYDTFFPTAQGIESLYKEGNQLRISFIYEGDIEQVVRYIYQYVPPETYEVTVPAAGATQGDGDEDGGLDPGTLAIVAAAAVVMVGGGIAGLSRMRAASRAKEAAASAVSETDNTSSLREYERIEREMRQRHAEMDRVLGPEDLEKQRTGSSAHDKRVREEMGKISDADKRREYDERMMKKYAANTPQEAYELARKSSQSAAKTAEVYRKAGNVAAAGEWIAHGTLAITNAAADVISKIPGYEMFRPAYRMATSIAGETAKLAVKNEYKNKTMWQTLKVGAVKGAVKGTFEGLRGFLPKSGGAKAASAFLGEVLGEMSGNWMEGKDVYKNIDKNVKSGAYNAISRFISDKMTGKSEIDDPTSLWDGLRKVLGTKEVRHKFVSYFVRNLGKPFIV